MVRLYFIIAFVGLFSYQTKAQTINGTIIDSDSQVLIDAYIYSLNSDAHAHSDISGRFSCGQVEVGDTLLISFVGFETYQLIITDRELDSDVIIQMTEANYKLDQVYISNSLKTVNQVSTVDLNINPVNSSQEVLRKVPGLFIGQHAGGGKAEQIFLRGFDIDHGTDITLTVDGLPVNMVSHAHGQGYSDLHFLIPETIDKIDFAKGPYYTDKGNFNTAGYVDFQTKDRLEQSSIGFEMGQFNTLRTYGLFDLISTEDPTHDAYIASEYISTDGPVESPQNFHRFNLMGKYNLNLEADQLTLTASTFSSEWRASGQIPQRLVDAGVITRFGSVDDTEGGKTSRTNLLLDHTKIINNNSFAKTRAFYSQYDFELYSNFTFFLEDPINGDQIRQRESRSIYGIESTLYNTLTNSPVPVELSTGIGLRHDDINDNELSHTLNRTETLENIALGDVNETNIYGFVDAQIELGDWIINPGARIDYFNFEYTDRLQTLFSNQQVSKAQVSPKFNILYNPNPNIQLFFKSGIGFHSNDSRVVVAQEGEEILPSAYGTDIGFIWKPNKNVWINTALWYLLLDQEFVYVGDAGIVEPSGSTRRMGIDFGIRYQLTEELYFDSDFNYTYARSIDEESGENYIPLAPDMTITGGLTYQKDKFNTSIKYRYLKDRAANEDKSIIAEGYLITDLNANYQFNSKWRIGIVIENLFDQEWNEAQFATESRLQSEVNSVEEIHFTPGTPFFFKANVRYSF